MPTITNFSVTGETLLFTDYFLLVSFVSDRNLDANTQIRTTDAFLATVVYNFYSNKFPAGSRGFNKVLLTHASFTPGTYTVELIYAGTPLASQVITV